MVWGHKCTPFFFFLSTTRYIAANDDSPARVKYIIFSGIPRWPEVISIQCSSFWWFSWRLRNCCPHGVPACKVLSAKESARLWIYLQIMYWFHWIWVTVAFAYRRNVIRFARLVVIIIQIQLSRIHHRNMLYQKRSHSHCCYLQIRRDMCLNNHNRFLSFIVHSMDREFKVKNVVLSIIYFEEQYTAQNTAIALQEIESFLDIQLATTHVMS